MSILLHVPQRGLICMKYRMFAMAERLLRFMIGADVVFCAAMCLSLCVMLACGDMVRRATETEVRRHGGRLRLVGRTREITWQWTALVPGVNLTRGLPVFQGAKLMTMSGQRLMGRLCVVLADLVVTRRLAMKMRGLFVMARCGHVVIRGVVCRGHGYPSVERRMISGTLPPLQLQPQGRKIPTTWRLRWFVAAIPGSLSLAQARLVVSEPSARYRPPVGLPEPREGGHMNCGIFNWPWRDLTDGLPHALARCPEHRRDLAGGVLHEGRASPERQLRNRGWIL